jgi:two-component system, OmpR family, sensor histidine kinase KdpD
MRGYAWALAATAACTAAGMAMRERFDLVNIAMVYVLAVVIVALRHSRGPAIATTIMGVAVFDFAFVPPQGTFTVDDLQYLLTFAIMLAVGLVISGLKESARRQAAAQARLELEAGTERIRSALLASISHDLRTPLAVIAGASSTLFTKKQSLSESEQSELARSIFEQSRQMSEHVAKVLQMTRLEAGAIELQRDWESLSDIAGTVLRRLADRLATHRVVVDLPEELPLVRVDATLIEQVLANLLENSVRHTPPGTVVQLRAKLTEREIIVSVEDFGPGLPEAEIERVFAKFHRAAAEGATPGMGLGLSICRAIVSLHGGRSWAERVSGGGLAFRFTLPVEPVPSLPAELAAG